MAAEDHPINMTPEELSNEANCWADLLFTKDHEMSVPHTLQELHDFRFLMEQASTVYSELTCGALSKTSYYAREVIAQANYCTEQFINEAVLDVLERIEDGESLSDIRREFRDN